jgi:endo-1,4-beta-D-glucanase Y
LIASACNGLIVMPGGSSGSAGTAGTVGVSGSAGTTGRGGSAAPGGTTGSAGTGNAAGTGATIGTGTAGNGAAGTDATGAAGAAGSPWRDGGASGSGTAGAGAAGVGGGSAGGAGGTMPARGPTPAMPGMNFPFPQNRSMAGCVFPTGNLNADVVAAYNQWKNDTVTTNGANGFRRVQRTSSDGVSMSTPANSTVSEGIGYGMLIAVYMNDQSLFDDLWKYEQGFLDKYGLMDWAISSDGKTRTGTGAATDADEDMAFALVMASQQWGGQGSLSKKYSDYALGQIDNIWNNEIYQSKLIRNGDTWGDWNNLNISYFAPAYYRVFDMIDTDTTHAWADVVTTVYDTITAALNASNKNMSNGLVPAWCTSTGTPAQTTPGQAAEAFYYQYDACRTPFRIGLDWCWFGETRARDYVAKTSTFFSGVGAANIVDSYNMDGTPYSSAHAVSAGQSAAFLGPAAVGAMSNASYQSFLDAAYGRLATHQLLVGGAYYDESWSVMSMLMLTGNFLNYTAITPAH